ncbi:hypothetical protein FRB96_008649 [Tulasnella sp. 330]|nr:hypothetical protein FRB96_008649 [Tulasnella sp. 330]
MPSAKVTKYIGLFILTLATIFASIELGLTISERIKINDIGLSSATERLDYLIFCSGWTILFCVSWIIIELTVKAGFLSTPTPHLIYYVITAVLWLVGAVLWNRETKDNGCDFGHNLCSTNKTIQGTAWMQLLKHTIGTLRTLNQIRQNRQNNGDGKGNAGFNGDGNGDRYNMNQRV